MMSPGCCLVTLHQFFLLCIRFQHITKCSICSGSLSMRRCRRRIRHKWRYVETWFFSQHQTKHSSSSFEYATSNCCKAGINPFFSSTGSGTVPKDPPCGNRVTFVSIVQSGGNSSSPSARTCSEPWLWCSLWQNFLQGTLLLGRADCST